MKRYTRLGRCHGRENCGDVVRKSLTSGRDCQIKRAGWYYDCSSAARVRRSISDALASLSSSSSSAGHAGSLLGSAVNCTCGKSGWPLDALFASQGLLKRDLFFSFTDCGVLSRSKACSAARSLDRAESVDGNTVALVRIRRSCWREAGN